MIVEQFSELTNEFLGINVDIQAKLVETVVVIVVAWAARFLIRLALERRVQDLSVRYRLFKVLSYTLFTVAFLLVARTWFEGVQSLATFLGLLSAGLAIALQDSIANLAGWVFILLRRPLAVGDRIEIGGMKGDVVDQRLFAFAMLELGNWVGAEQSTGRLIYVPNSQIFKNPLFNYNKEFNYIWNEIPVLITFESNWQKTEEILQTIATKNTESLCNSAELAMRQASRKMMISFNKLTPRTYLTVKDSGVLITIRHLCEVRRRRQMEEDIWRDILLAFGAEPDIDLAYPTQRIYFDGPIRQDVKHV